MEMPSTSSRSLRRRGVLTEERDAPASHFRADIEGLRAVAVLLVVGYHAGVPWLPGGYVGVDVFFVLSGYLITGLLANEVDRSRTISLRGFYARRARRLLPGLAVMMAATLLVSVAVLTPLERVQLSATATATALYASNVWFALAESDYFAADTRANPLLHTWSLGVEEQFYFVWPLIVLASLRLSAARWRWWVLLGGATLVLALATWRLSHGGWLWLALLVWPLSLAAARWCPRERRPLAVVIAAISTLSLLLCIRLTETRQPLAFFASPTRAWEFGVGGFAALVGASSSLAGPRLRLTRALMSWGGLALVVGSAVALTRHSPFPGTNALLPVIGTIAILVVGGVEATSGAGRVLVTAPMQQIGRLSYSWYLWHWPALVFLAVAVPSASPAMRGVCALGSLGVAWLAYRTVENPIRHSVRLVPRPLVTLTGAAVLTVASVGGAIGIRALARQSLAEPVHARLAATTERGAFYERGCATGWGDARLRVCEFGDTTATAAASVVLMGDSQAAHWLPALERAADAHGWRLTTLIKVSCPSADVPFFNSRLRRTEHECGAWRSAALTWIATHRPDVVVLGNMVGYVAVLDQEGWYSQHPPAAWRDGLRRTFARLDATGTITVWLRVTPMMRFNVPECLARAAEHRWYDESQCGRARAAALSDELWAAEREAARGLSSVTLADLNGHFCDETTCPPMRGGQVLYRDANHITVAYAESLAPVLSSVIGASLEARRRASPAAGASADRR